MSVLLEMSMFPTDKSESKSKVSLDIQYKEIGEVSVASLKQVIVDVNKIDIISVGDLVENSVGIIW